MSSAATGSDEAQRFPRTAPLTLVVCENCVGETVVSRLRGNDGCDSSPSLSVDYLLAMVESSHRRHGQGVTAIWPKTARKLAAWALAPVRAMIHENRG